uniref:Uncharacterized protein n=1 Tax=Candidatus Kentrum sp. UNK TaxID=2126344 RepID=A0A451AWD0_9GAMM|nr:MAG: hypothetical protein BECKUNK1418G_GA0071005_102125 [Candidatus Kentron sp. UNK]VFK70359.1 MAG: hypothetical protein BECKUNK1418H_GA0071006_102725 [Candidatus Kentron sp. UNK]
MDAGLKQFAYGVVAIIAAILAGFFGGMICPMVAWMDTGVVYRHRKSIVTDKHC